MNKIKLVGTDWYGHLRASELEPDGYQLENIRKEIEYAGDIYEGIDQWLNLNLGDFASYSFQCELDGIEEITNVTIDWETTDLGMIWSDLMSGGYDD